ncbi:Tetratricopeptide repeat protein [Vibrio aerogenes CECT 7868]|uniref:Tetratricopeptide repeat protein n=1 Tax=Vibrio aerogenes CECT 7868 TaxID=1216006 RepID=A0A1M5Z740_9VIBR|nr:tetratricopeptide repeat protein [Vibrio aerogenes]SHI20066.1 Tetratricopeptide repeat protein [Vibrio aerogenes CECT 7868]
MKLRLIICLLLGVCCVVPVQAATLSPYATGKVMLAQKQAENDQLSKAIQTLRALKVSKTYDKAYVSRLLGVYYWESDQPASAIQYLSDAVTLNAFEPHEMWSLKRMLADLFVRESRYHEALPYYQALVQSAPQGTKLPELWLTIAQLHYQLEHWQDVLASIRQYDTFKLPDTVAPLSVQLGAQVQLKKYQAAVRTVKRLLALEPQKKDWWLQLTGLELKRERYKSALSTLELAQLQGIALSKSNQKLLAQLYGQCGIPERAARVMARLYQHSDTPEHLAQIAGYWQLAKEWDKALGAWQKAAKKRPAYHWRIAQIQFRQGKYQQALKSLDSFSQFHSKSQDKSKASVALLRAQVLYKLNRLEPALSQARKADTLRPSEEAKRWIKYLTRLYDYHQQNSSYQQNNSHQSSDNHQRNNGGQQNDDYQQSRNI